METIQKETLLIVDDIPLNIEILNGILGDDYETLFATSGKDALEIASQQIPDLVLLDVVMPDMDGYEVCARLKAEEKTHDIPIIFITANDSEEEESRGFIVGAVDYIAKPVRPSIVKARVCNHLELKRCRDFLKALSTIDGLTGIPNRRRFDEALECEWRRARRSLSPLSLSMVDIDFFKAFNDHYGHLAGDDCLRRLGKGLADALRRPADLIARYGGDEFVILLPDTDATGATVLAGRIQEKTKYLNIPHGYSSIADRVTLSIGVATVMPADDKTPLDLIDSADQLLYEAKKNGRNQSKGT